MTERRGMAIQSAEPVMIPADQEAGLTEFDLAIYESTVAARAYWCNKCGYHGETGPKHRGCGYYAFDSHSRERRICAALRQALADRTARDAAIRAEERAFVLDHMPRDAMIDALARYHVARGMVPYAHAGPVIDAALSAARAALLPASSLRPSGYGSASLGEAPEGSVDGHDKPGDATPGETGGK